MLGNEKEIKQLIGIMLDNACKYASKGAVTIRLDKTDRIHLSIHNCGGSITEEQKKHLFERFYRTDESRDRKAGGYGLGLAIAKSIVDHHQGKIIVKSSENKGTTFDYIFHCRSKNVLRKNTLINIICKHLMCYCIWMNSVFHI